MKVYVTYVLPFFGIGKEGQSSERSFRYSILGSDHFSSIEYFGDVVRITVHVEEEVALLFKFRYPDARVYSES